MSKYSNLVIEHRDTVALVTINRPDQLNALNVQTIKELGDALSSLDLNSSVRAVIITGAGEKAFVAGADIKEFYRFSAGEGKELSRNGQKTLSDLIEEMSTPVIAAINGFALGGGLELAMACHLRLASHNAKLGLPEVSLGVIPGYGGTQRLAQLAGKGKAMEMITTAEMITAEQALECGLINHVTTQSELLERCMEIAGKMARNSPGAIGRAIKAINAGYKEGVDGYKVEIDEFGNCFGTGDFREGTAAFIEKRKPSFTGT